MIQGGEANKIHQRDQAEKLFRAALAKASGFAEQDPRLTTTLRSLADVYMQENKCERAKPLLERELSIFKTMGEEYPDAVYDLAALGRIYTQEGNLPKGEKYFRSSLALQDKYHGACVTDELDLVARLTCNLKNQEKYKEAGDFLRRMLALRRIANPATPELA